MRIPAERPGVVLDGNVVVQAVLTDSGPAAGILRAIQEGRCDLFVSSAILREMAAVLNYPDIRKRNPDLTDERLSDFLKWLRYRGNVVRRVPHVFDYPRDKKDEAYVDLAAAARANFLVSRDRDLLSLMTAHSLTGKKFRQTFHYLKVLTPEAFLRELA